MDQVHLMKVFSAVGERRNFAAAARQLDISPAAVTRAVAALEQQLGVSLVQRTTRHLSLTEAGLCYLDDCRRILDSIRQAHEAVAGVNTRPSGHLTVTASVLFGKIRVMPCILEYLQRYPQVDVSTLFNDRVVNLIDEGVDVAVRIGHLPDSSLKALQVGSTRRVLCASPDYLARHGVPQRPEDLLQHAMIVGSGVSPRTDRAFASTNLQIKPRLTVTSNDLAIDAARAGIGIAHLHDYQASAELASGQLQIVLPDFEEAPWPVHVVHRETRYGSSKVRAFIDMLVAHLREQPMVR